MTPEQGRERERTRESPKEFDYRQPSKNHERKCLGTSGVARKSHWGQTEKREREDFLQISQSCRKAPSCLKCIKLAFLSLSRDRGRSFLFSRLKVGLSRNISFPRDSSSSSSIISTAVRTKRGGRTWRNTLCVLVPDTA